MKDLAQKLKFLGIYQIAGGVLGIGRLFLNMEKAKDFAPFGLVIFGFSILCGYQLLKGKYEVGMKISIINQFTQILLFALPGFAYSYISGIAIKLALDVTTDISLNMDVGVSNFYFLAFAKHNTTFIGINIVALIIMNVIFKWQKQLENIKQRTAAI